MPCGVLFSSRPMVRTHQPGQAVFRSVLPEDIDWTPFPAFPPSVRLAVVVGQPSECGPYTIRVKVPSGVKLMPHRHPEDRVYTVMSGVFYIGLGDLAQCGPGVSGEGYPLSAPMRTFAGQIDSQIFTGGKVNTPTFPDFSGLRTPESTCRRFRDQHRPGLTMLPRCSLICRHRKGLSPNS